jgi:hypothetical protein
MVVVEGRSRVSNIIKSITLSSWTHAALYKGRLHHIENPDLLYYLEYHYDDGPTEPLLIEALLGAGTMGSEIAVWIALQSFRVTAQDKNPKALAVMLKRATGQFAKNLKLEPEIRAATDRLMPDPKVSVLRKPM